MPHQTRWNFKAPTLSWETTENTGCAFSERKSSLVLFCVSFDKNPHGWADRLATLRHGQLYSCPRKVAAVIDERILQRKGINNMAPRGSVCWNSKRTPLRQAQDKVNFVLHGTWLIFIDSFQWFCTTRAQPSTGWESRVLQQSDDDQMR